MMPRILRRLGGPLLAALGALALATLATGAQAADPPKWAGLYYEWQTGKYGSARPFDTRRDARRAAYNAAVTRGINPKRYRGWARQVRGGCIVVFKELDAYRWGWGIHRVEAAARLRARNRCEQGGRRCRERVKVCSARGF